MEKILNLLMLSNSILHSERKALSTKSATHMITRIDIHAEKGRPAPLMDWLGQILPCVAAEHTAGVQAT